MEGSEKYARLAERYLDLWQRNLVAWALDPKVIAPDALAAFTEAFKKVHDHAAGGEERNGGR